MNTEKSSFIEKSRQYVQAILNGDFDSIVANFNEELASQINASVLRQSWDSAIKALPTCQGILSEDYKKAQGMDFVSVVLDYSSSGLRISFGFDHDGKISRLGVSYVPHPSTPTEAKHSDKFSETPIKIGDPQYPLDGKLTMSKAIGDVPVVILVHGSGSHDMNETIGSAGNAVFADLAYGLAERGIASIRYNKRYYQYPETVTQTITVWEEVINDVNAAIALARTTNGINKNKLFIIGHSLGGVLAPEIARENPDIAGFIALAGSARKLEDIILDQNKAVIKAMNTTDAEKQAILDRVTDLVNQVKALTPESPHCAIFNINSEYWLSLNETNAYNIVAALPLPMLFLHGDADFQVTIKADFALWQKLLQGRKDAQFKLYPRLNHLFMKSNGKADVTEYNTKANVEEQVIADIAEWIHLIGISNQ
ncbi:alpha/beta fold hydrolase [Desulfosporosinus sp. Sb-LF]|uniref:alpha/beta hydrolase n=1 Tax=Desulfosporosinus sp. Sb-LF TaxID=2560027 RepID=UPI00107F43E0|nr:alpha/beta fold hydrolase [Desulfosporosinus sp. Sb-LF]TGE34517.1 alpha/beta fold hydrolase [Desulfosporosinus sp. Sb-LF]